tara:strand:- start:5041 stop:5733 length:693 start_codon:yes stop_codon:yes gene_type:complete
MSGIVYPRSRVVLPTVEEARNGKKQLTTTRILKNIHKYYLILDIDETILYAREYTPEGLNILKLRPGLLDFLNKLYNHFNIYLFTAGSGKYAHQMADLINKHGNRESSYFKGIYSRDHMKLGLDGLYTKCLRKLHEFIMKDNGEFNKRNSHSRVLYIMNKIHYTVLIDNLIDNMKYQRSNGINIIDFEGDKDDTCLFILSDYLLDMSRSNKSVRLFHTENNHKINKIIKN